MQQRNPRNQGLQKNRSSLSRPTLRPIPRVLKASRPAAAKSAKGSKPAWTPLTVEETIGRCRVFRDGVCMPTEFSPQGALNEVRDSGGFVWLDVHSPAEEHMEKIAEMFDIDELIVEDAVQAHQRPKVERYEDQLFFVLRTITYSDSEEVRNSRDIIQTGEVQMVVSKDFILTIHHGQPVPGLVDRLDRNMENEEHTPIALGWEVADHIVSEYNTIVDSLDDAVDSLEEDVFSPDSDLDIQPIYQLKREILEMRHAISPLGAALNVLIHQGDVVNEELRTYFRDVLDNQTIARDQVSQFDERLSSLIDAAVAKVSLQQNMDMRRLSVIVAMISVPTLIAGVYGMNFDTMPELHWLFGYPMALGLMLLSVIIIYVFCRRRNYI
ncbi:transporter of the CorA metal ion transporter family protein [Corynebacterium renale]|uniref:magnesium/cobalt transporter CorA n=1 Tax=Corynebacterium renale TaxID=1724 RepID=UPI000DA41A14|nr:magnesium/cobalt transporter CorA [Corynebacterium renale]SQG64660.1 transporter of the CorA metal ion transporter family protein [Corynebacterium renale]STC95839.1 transporter of the CorA metal ion transporter family protein [Corynebacterium renale]